LRENHLILGVVGNRPALVHRGKRAEAVMLAWPAGVSF
jgi:hypothetical protein